MKFEFKVLLIAVILILTSVILSNDDLVHAQSDNSIGQDGDGNEASQTDAKSQDSNENTMCISGKSVSLSCNNLSNANDISQRLNDEQKLVSIQDMIYQNSNTVDENDGGYYTASVSCDSGDTAISSNFKLDNIDFVNAPSHILKNTLDIPNNKATLQIFTPIKSAIVTVYINCFDNP
jgi:hypothetical protein